MKVVPNQIICSDNILAMKSWPDDCIDSIITDPPYGLEFMGKDWDKLRWEGTPGKAKVGAYMPNQNPRCLKCGKLQRNHKKSKCQCIEPEWDYRISEYPQAIQHWHYQWAKECLRIAKPGAIMLCFGGTRTFHRVTCAIEDAGWQIRDCLMWLYGSGFPKSHNISKAIDKAAGAKRKVIGVKDLKRGRPIARQTTETSITGWNKPDYPDKVDITIPATDLAQLWDGYGTTLKPAWEPIIVAMKPLDGTFAHNAEAHGVAGLNIDGGRIDYEEGGTIASNPLKRVQEGHTLRCNDWLGGKSTTKDKADLISSKGRWPANLILDETSAEMLDAQTGITKPKKGRKGKRGGCGFGFFDDEKSKNEKGIWPEDFGGGASRFFYCPKASRSERNAGLKEMAEKRPDSRTDIGKGIWVEKGTAKQANHHPTVKPLKLMEYLCTLLKPPSEHPILLDPFCGSGSTLMAAFNTGCDYIGIDKEAEYIEIAKRRVDSCKEQRKYQMFA